jgi:hypothetical protein
MLSRLMLRLLTVKALSEPDADGLYPTIAGKRVFDSKITPFQEDAINNEVPVAMVYTMSQVMQRENKGRTATPLGMHHEVDLIIEIVVATEGVTQIKIGGKTQKAKVLVPVETDAELEALLDLFEAQVVRALVNPLNKWCMLWAKMVTDTIQYQSEREADGDKNNRLAMRQISYKCRICADPMPRVGQSPDGKTSYVNRPKTSLPKTGTYLDAFMEAMVEYPNAQTALDVFQSTYGTEGDIFIPALKRIGIQIDADTGEGTTGATMDIELGED